MHLDALGRKVGVYGHELVEAPLICVLTRIRVRSVWVMPAMWRAFRRVESDAKSIPELRRTAFLLEGPRSFFILSIWSNEAGLLAFGTQVHSHLAAVRRALASASRHGLRAEIWSTQWRIHAASNNTQWGEPDNWASLLRRGHSNQTSVAPNGR
ncbi:MAG: hypothetical protein ACYDB4_02145 [Candidatus Dormibacteraceae bacterium]